jgi:hypothetical protein
MLGRPESGRCDFLKLLNAMPPFAGAACDREVFCECARKTWKFKQARRPSLKAVRFGSGGLSECAAWGVLHEQQIIACALERLAGN